MSEENNKALVHSIISELAEYMLKKTVEDFFRSSFPDYVTDVTITSKSGKFLVEALMEVQKK